MGIARNIARLIPNGSGLLPNANIEAVAASKLTGSVPLANGGNRVIKSTAITNSTRQTFGAADIITYWSVNYTKISSTSDLYIHVLLPTWSNYNGGNYVGINIDGTVDFKGSGRAVFGSDSGHWSFLQMRTGLAAGSRTISIYQDVLDNGGNYVIAVLNPNNSDDSRNQQMGSVMVIYEVEP